MKRYGILGYPLGHTMSPPIHKRLFELEGAPETEYQTYEVPTERLEERLPALLELDGLNITIPHKVAMLDAVDRLDETAGRYGAVNVIARRDGKLIGYNTDCYGFTRAVRQLGADLSQPVCVLGAGGVGRMFAIESALHGAPVTIAARESSLGLARRVREEVLAQRPDASVRVCDIGSLQGGWHLVINATPAGMYPHTQDCPVQPEALRGCEYLFDSIYNPSETVLLRTAREAGLRVLGGMAMLVWQAVKAHEIWSGASCSDAVVSLLINEMEAELAQLFPLSGAEAGR